MQEAVPKSEFVDMCRELTWGQLTAWAGRSVVDKGRKIQHKGAVHSLSMTCEGLGLLAWVDVEEPFAVLIELEGNELLAQCMCNSMFTPCEHAVAVIIEYIVYLKRGVPIPEAAANDPRFHLI